MIDLYDSEVAEIEKVWGTLQERTNKSHNYDSFDREIRERFAEIGFKVRVNWYETNVAGVKLPEIEVIDRIQQREFDHDQMRYELTVSNPLGLPSSEVGLIKPDEKWTEAQAKEIHKHGPGCEH